jgi:2-amino-4-hydroxy-6-hydroxymethyldihydropteridine diphosphokinase
MTLWRPAYVGLGSNLEDPRSQLLRAAERIEQLPRTRLLLRSPLYASRPHGLIAQPDFVNAVVGLLTQLDAIELLGGLRLLERSFGRPEVHERWGPRILDLDLLVFGREVRNDPQLTLPHPGIVERNFVLYPLADIAPDLEVPGLGRVAELKGRVTSEGIRSLSSPDTDS